MKKIVILILLFAASAQAAIGITRPVVPGPISGPGIGKFEQDQIIVNEFMRKARYATNEKAGDQGEFMKDVLTRLIKKDADVKDWLILVNSYLGSNDFANLSAVEQDKELLDVKRILRSAINKFLIYEKSQGLYQTKQ